MTGNDALSKKRSRKKSSCTAITFEQLCDQAEVLPCSNAGLRLARFFSLIGM